MCKQQFNAPDSPEHKSILHSIKRKKCAWKIVWRSFHKPGLNRTRRILRDPWAPTLLEYKPGLNEAPENKPCLTFNRTRKTWSVFKEDKRNGDGFHLFLRKQDALCRCEYSPKNSFVVKVKIAEKDVLHTGLSYVKHSGTRAAVYGLILIVSSFILPQEEYDRAMAL